MLVFATSLFAQAGAPIVEISQGPLIAPARIVGMGGAYASIAEGTGAQQFNPAAVATRSPHNEHQVFDWDWAFDFLVVGPGINDGVDFENSGRRTKAEDERTVITGGLSFVADEFGCGLSAGSQAIQLLDSGVTYGVTTAGFNAGYNFLGGQLIAGAGVMVASAAVDQDETTFLELTGFGLTFGGVARPENEPYRFGFSYRTELVLEPSERAAAEMRRDLRVPSKLRQPWELVVGLSYSVGSRALNHRATFGAKTSSTGAAPIELERDYITFAVDGVLTGDNPGAIGFDSWVTGGERPAGQGLTTGLRVGIDSEFWPNRLRGRMGFYWEPSRFELGSGRTHVTAGFDLRLGELIWDWRFSAAADIAYYYSNLMLSIGWWY